MRALFDEVPEACDNTLWIAERGRRRARVRPAGAARASRCPRATPRSPTCASSPSKARRSATGSRRAPVVLERLEYELGVIESMGFSAYFLVVWDIVHYAKSRGHPRRSGAGERGRLVRRVLPAHRRHRPDQVRPAVRAVPQPGPQADARHRHGLRLPVPRRDDQVRRAEVRRRPRRADRHVLHDQGAGRGARRGAGARLPVRARRQDRQAHAAAHHGPGHPAVRVPRAEPEVRGRLQDGRASCGSSTSRSRRASGSSTSPRASRACAARTASTPPRS